MNESSLLGIVASKAAQVAKNILNWIKSKVDDSYRFEAAESSYAIKCKTIVQNAISNVAGLRISCWVQATVRGENRAFQTSVANPAGLIYNAIETRWQYKCADNDLLGSLSPVFPPLPENLLDNVGVNVSQDVGRIGVKFALKEFVADLIASCVGVYLSGVLFVPGDPITMSVAALVVLLRRIFVNRDAQRQAICSAMSEKLAAGFVQGKATAAANFSAQLAPLRKQVVERIYEPVRSIRDRFAAARAKAILDLAKGELERKRIANDCRAIRERVVGDGTNGGIAGELKRFVAEVEPIC